MKRNTLIYYITLSLILSVFTFIFFFSVTRVINIWTYTEAHINYSEGFINRGLFGSLMLFSKKYFLIQTKYFYSAFFYFFSLINIIFFFYLIKQYQKNFIIFIFLALNPALILFPFYDLGGYARFEIISISSILIHSYLANKFYKKELSESIYFFYLKYLIIPFIIISIFINEIIIFTIPFHFFTTLQIIKNKKKKLFIYFLLLIPAYMIYTHRMNAEIAFRLFDNLQNKQNIEFWILEAIAVPSFIDRFNVDGFYMFTKGNIIQYLIIFIVFFSPIYIFFNFLRIKNYIIVNKNYFCFLSIVPFFFIFLIARDWGRWIHLIIFVTFCFYTQFPIKKSLDIKLIKIFKFKYIIYITVLFFYLFFIRIPHCCNIEKLQITIYGGAVEKVKVLYDMIFEKKIDINKRFKKNY
jgi:hypothetical protein